MKNIRDRLSEIGIDTDSVITRLGGNEQLYLSICHKFLQDKNYQLFQDAISSQNMNAAIIYLHTLKGVAVNLGFLRLQFFCSILYEKIRAGEHLLSEETLNSFTEEYNRITKILLE